MPGPPVTLLGGVAWVALDNWIYYVDARDGLPRSMTRSPRRVIRPLADLGGGVVVLSPEGSRSLLEVDLFSGQLGIRLALDRLVPEWGGRMLFFRAGKLTLEVIAAEETTESSFWGIAYLCADIDKTLARLHEADVSVTAIREGRKPGTRVATVKSRCLGIPTLLIGPAT